MPVNPTTASANTPPAATSQVRGASSNLGKDDFLKLFVTQLKHQDPMSPMQDAEFMSQMTGFSTLEQIANLAQSQALAQSVGLIGRTVTYENAAGEEVTGKVEKVVSDKGAQKLTIDGVGGIEPAKIKVVS